MGWKIKMIPWIPLQNHFILGEQRLISILSGARICYIFLAMKLSLVSFYNQTQSSSTEYHLPWPMRAWLIRYLSPQHWLFPPLTHLETIVGSCVLFNAFNQRELGKCQYESGSLSNYIFPCPPVSIVWIIRILHQKSTSTEAFVNFPPFVVFLL